MVRHRKESEIADNRPALHATNTITLGLSVIWPSSIFSFHRSPYESVMFFLQRLHIEYAEGMETKLFQEPNDLTKFLEAQGDDYKVWAMVQAYDPSNENYFARYKASWCKSAEVPVSARLLSIAKYSGDPKTGRVRFLNGQNVFGMVRSGRSTIPKPDG